MSKTMRVDDFSLGYLLNLAGKTDAAFCKDCTVCLCKNKGKVPVAAAVQVLEALRNTDKIHTPEQFNHFVKTLEGDVSKECLERYKKETKALGENFFPRSETEIREAAEMVETFGLTEKQKGAY